VVARRDRRDLGQFAAACQQNPAMAGRGGGAQRLVALGACAPEETEGVAQEGLGQPGLLREPARRQIVGVAPRRCLADLDQALAYRAPEIGIGQSQRDPQALREAALRLLAVRLDRDEQVEGGAGILGVVARKPPAARIGVSGLGHPTSRISFSR
jgi:hypothetical protein